MREMTGIEQDAYMKMSAVKLANLTVDNFEALESIHPAQAAKLKASYDISYPLMRDLVFGTKTRCSRDAKLGLAALCFEVFESYMVAHVERREGEALAAQGGQLADWREKYDYQLTDWQMVFCDAYAAEVENGRRNDESLAYAENRERDELEFQSLFEYAYKMHRQRGSDAQDAASRWLERYQDALDAVAAVGRKLGYGSKE